MAVKQNALDYAEEYPFAPRAVQESFYVGDCLSGADSIDPFPPSRHKWVRWSKVGVN